MLVVDCQADSQTESFTQSLRLLKGGAAVDFLSRLV